MTRPFLHVFPTQHSEQVITWVSASQSPSAHSVLAALRDGGLNQISRSHLGWLLKGVHEPNRVFSDVIIHS